MINSKNEKRERAEGGGAESSAPQTRLERANKTA